MKIVGFIKQVSPVFQASNSFKKQDVWLDKPHPKYPQVINIEFHNKTCDLLNGFSVGDEVEILFDIRGKEYKGRVYNTLVGIEISAAPKANEERLMTQQKIHEANSKIS